MSTSLDYFSRGIARAFERRKEKAKQQQSSVQPVQKVNSHVTESTIEVTPTPSVPSVKQFDEEKYRTTIITKMKALIAKHKGITANHGQ